MNKRLIDLACEVRLHDNFAQFRDVPETPRKAIVDLIDEILTGRKVPEVPETKEANDPEISWQFWKEFVLDDKGNLMLDAVKRELSDYHTVMSYTAKVYSHVTGDRASNIFIHPSVITSLADENYEEIFKAEHLDAQQETELADIMSQFGNLYLDEPDGGSVTLQEQVRRMAEDAKLLHEIRKLHVSPQNDPRGNNPPRRFTYNVPEALHNRITKQEK